MLVENQTLFKCKQFHSNPSGEYINDELKAFFTQKKILYEISLTYCYEYNGVIEQFNCTIQIMARAMLMYLDKHYWAEASATVVYLKNRLPHSVVKGMTPY